MTISSSSDSGIIGDISTCKPYSLRKKWTKSHQSLQEGGILLKDSQAAQNAWPMAIVTKAILRDDGRVRKVEVKTTQVVQRLSSG